jgi:hypothetical protein
LQSRRTGSLQYRSHAAFDLAGEGRQALLQWCALGHGVSASFRGSLLMANLLELACGLVHEKTLAGVSEDIQSHYLSNVLKFFENDSLRADLLSLQEGPKTFQYIRAFVKQPSRAVDHPKLRAGLAATAALKGPSSK